MEVICAWCRKHMTEVDGDSHSDPASHGICADCRNTFAFQEGVSLQHYIDNIPYPIVVVDTDMEVLFGNARASEILGKAPEALTGGYSTGDVFECLNSRLPEG